MRDICRRDITSGYVLLLKERYSAQVIGRLCTILTKRQTEGQGQNGLPGSSDNVLSACSIYHTSVTPPMSGMCDALPCRLGKDVLTVYTTVSSDQVISLGKRLSISADRV